ncbi:hypothetical protein NXS19_004249 [Fusarium pseudograminearum]|nr:hypothetical protein NXS19_004249 [Fusarium pseudograminearum]
MADSQTSRTSASHETRQTLSERNTRRLELAKQMGKTVDDLIWDPNEMAFTWDDMQSETTTTLANGEPTNTMDAAMVEHNDVMTIIAAYSKRDLLQPGLPPYIPSTIATIPPKDASRFLALMNGEHILAKDWAPIRNALQARHPLKQDTSLCALKPCSP